MFVPLAQSVEHRIWAEGTGAKPVRYIVSCGFGVVATVCGSSSMVERRPSKSDVAGSSPVPRSARSPAWCLLLSGLRFGLAVAPGVPDSDSLRQQGL